MFGLFNRDTKVKKYFDSQEGQELAGVITQHIQDYSVLVIVQAKKEGWDVMTRLNTLQRQMFQIFTEDYKVYDSEFFELVLKHYLINNTTFIKEFILVMLDEMPMKQDDYLEFLSTTFHNYQILIRRYGVGESKRAYKEAVEHTSGL